MPHSVNNDSSATATMSRPSSTSTSSANANAFPRPAGATLVAPEPVGDQLSPSRSTFSFESTPKSVQAISERSVGFDDARHSRTASRGAIGQRPTTGNTARQRAQYFEDSFAYKEDSTSSARDRVTKDAPIIADLRTNVIIKDEYTLVTDLSHHLSQRYQRPESSIMITVNHSACLLLGGSFEPTYILTISALPVSLQPTLNKRNAAMTQTFLFETIGVHADRGIVKFVPIAEDCMATNGTTIMGEIERLERQQLGDGSGLARALTKSSKRSAVAKAKSSFQLSRNNSRAVAAGRVTPPLPNLGPTDSGVAVNDKIQEEPTTTTTTLPRKASAATKQLKDKSASKSTPFLKIPAPPIPEDGPAPKVGKRKSFISIFRR